LIEAHPTDINHSMKLLKVLFWQVTNIVSSCVAVQGNKLYFTCHHQFLSVGTLHIGYWFQTSENVMKSDENECQCNGWQRIFIKQCHW